MILFKNVSKYYFVGGHRLEVLKNINLRIEKGEYIALMGPSGSGKTTLLDIIGLLNKPSKGEYFLDEKNTGEFTDDYSSMVRNKKIGFIFQTFNLFPQLSIVENVEVPFEYSNQEWKRDKAVDLLKKVGLGKRVKHKPTELSGGEMQRVAIARALANDPDIIVADEPTGNLDEKTGLEIMDIFDELNSSGRTIIMATHNVNFKKRVRKVYEMKDGYL